MLLKWFRRWRYRHQWKRCTSNPEARNLITFLQRDLPTRISRYRTSVAINTYGRFMFANVETFIQRIELALDVVRQGEYTDRYDKKTGDHSLSIDDYLTTQNGYSVEAAGVLISIGQSYSELMETIDQKEEKKRHYYQRHFNHLNQELNQLLRVMCVVVDQ